MSMHTLFRTLREQIADRIRTDILTGELAAGARLRELDLAARYGVSRGPVRDALLQLTQEGLLVAKPNCGVTVSQPPERAIQPLLLDLRRRIECFAVDMLIADSDAALLRKLGAVLEELEDACRAGDIAELVRQDMAFHRLIVTAAGPDTVELWVPIVMRMWLRYGRHDDMMDSYLEHAEILQAIRDGDAAAVHAALERNIQ